MVVARGSADPALTRFLNSCGLCNSCLSGEFSQWGTAAVTGGSPSPFGGGGLNGAGAVDVWLAP